MNPNISNKLKIINKIKKKYQRLRTAKEKVRRMMLTIYPNNQKISIYKTRSKKNNNFKTETTYYKAKLNLSGEDYITANKEISRFFNNIRNRLINKMKERDKIFVVFDHPSLDIPISFPLMEKQFLTSEMITDRFTTICQSKKELKIDDNFTIYSMVAQIPTGSGLPWSYEDYLSKQIKFFDNFCITKRSIVTIKNHDNLCGISSFLVAKELIDGKKTSNITRDKGMRSIINKSKKLAKILNLPDRPCTFEDIRVLEEYFKEYQVTIYNEDFKLTGKPFYIGIPGKHKFIYLLLFNNHYNVIRSMTGFLNSSYFCHYCKKKYDHITKHWCNMVCFYCRQTNCAQSKRVQCHQCKTFCNNDLCLNIHLKLCTLCERTCNECKQPLKFPHVCGEYSKFCYSCKISVKYDHRCYIKKDAEKPPRFNSLIFFDYEATQNTGIHIPNLIIAHKYIEKNLKEQVVFHDNEKFCDWLFTQKNSIAIAHNMKGYDGVFIMNYLMTKALLDFDSPLPTIILQGVKFIFFFTNGFK